MDKYGKVAWLAVGILSARYLYTPIRAAILVAIGMLIGAGTTAVVYEMSKLDIHIVSKKG